jgi:hypothetical protein
MIAELVPLDSRVLQMVAHLKRLSFFLIFHCGLRYKKSLAPTDK